MLHLGLVFLGGGAGSVARYVVTKLVSDRMGSLPFGTLGVNVIGCFLIGVIYAALQKYSIGNQTEIKLLLATGFCGGFTTFSTFAYENNLLWQQGSNFLSLAYILGSLGLGLTATSIGILLLTK